MPKLVATRALSYATRRLVAGDEFEARPQDVRLLIGIRKARLAQPEQSPEPPQEAQQEAQQVREPEEDEREAQQAKRPRAEAERPRATRRD